MNHKLSCRAATEADIPYLYDLRLESMEPHLLTAGVTLTAEEHMERVRDQLDTAEILLVESLPAGMIKIARKENYWHVMQLQVSPSMHGKGVGSEILQRVIAEAQAANAQLTLGVLKVNPAKRLYERLGFVITGESLREFKMVWRGTDAELLDRLRKLERDVHAACLDSNASRVMHLIHADFKEFGRSGKTWDRPALLRALDGSPEVAMHSQDFAIQSRTSRSCLLTYRSANVMPDGALTRHALRSSLWVHADGQWQMQFHQGTATDAFSRQED